MCTTPISDPDFSCRQAGGSTRGSTRGPCGPKKNYDYHLITFNLCWLRLRGVYKSRWDIGVNGCTKFEIIVCNKCMIVGGVL